MICHDTISFDVRSTLWLQHLRVSGAFKPETHRANIGHLKRLEGLGQIREQICSVCSAALEAFGTCEVLECWLLAIWAIRYSDWLCASCMTILIGGVPANQHHCGRGRILCAPLNTMACALFFYALRSITSCFHVLDYWHKTTTTWSQGDLLRVCSFWYKVFKPSCWWKWKLNAI